MKNSLLIRLSYLLLPVVVACCKQPDIDPDTLIRVNAIDTLTIAQVRALTDLAVPGSIFISDAGKQGLFLLDKADKATVDNMGVTLVTVNGRRYKRQYSGSASAFWFGIVPNEADISSKLQVALDATNDLTIPDGIYTQLEEVRMKSNLAIRANPGKVTINLPKSYVSLANAVNTSAALENVLIDGLSWNVTSKETGIYGVITIDGPSVANLTIQNCTSTDATAKDSTNFLTLKIQAGKTAASIIVQNNTIQAKRMACEIFNHDNYGIYAGRDILVSNNYFTNCRFGISLSGPLENLTVDKNHLQNCSLYGIEIAGAAHNVKITNNWFEGNFDKYLEGSNDGGGNGSIQGGMEITGNRTVGTCTGGIQLFNAGAAKFTKNTFIMTGRLELLTTSCTGGTYSENTLESTGPITIICDNAPNNTFTNNTISNRNSPANVATFRAYGEKAVNVVLTSNKLIKGQGGTYHDAVSGATSVVSKNYDEAGNPVL